MDETIAQGQVIRLVNRSIKLLEKESLHGEYIINIERILMC